MVCGSYRKGTDQSDDGKGPDRRRRYARVHGVIKMDSLIEQARRYRKVSCTAGPVRSSDFVYLYAVYECVEHMRQKFVAVLGK